MTDLTQLLRLEVERDPDPGEVLNLNPNPSGELGAWAYETPVPGSDLIAGVVSGVPRLTYYSPGSVPSYFYTEPMPAAPGQYAAARWLAPSVLGQYAVRFEWLDSTKTVISATTASAAMPGSFSPRAYAPLSAAPAGTLYVRFRFDHYSGSGGNPDALTSIAFMNLVVTVADSAAEVTWTRTNLMPTPTGGGGRGGWGSGGGDVGVSSTVTLDGRSSLTLTADSDRPAALVSPPISVIAGRDYALQARSRPQTKRREVTVAARFFKANGDEIGTFAAGTAMETAGDWTPVVGGVVTAPTNAATMRLRAQYKNLDKDEVHYLNAVMVEQASTVGAWFDGFSTSIDGAITDVTFEWAGTPHASASVATSSIGDPGELVPVPFQNILGPSHHISVDREGFNVGSLGVQLFDAVLDPTQSEIIRPGRRVRLVTTAGDVVYTGKIFTGSVTYHLLEHDEQKRAEVSITAVDGTNSLASAPRREGVATIAELPYVLEGAGVPWSCNGSGNQVPTADVVAYNDNASALDQVAVTRDTVLGYAWVDRNGVLQAWDRDQIGTTVAAVLDETKYNADIDVDFDLDRIINSVTVRVLRVIATTGASEEVVFGPYVDVDSYRQYGEHAQEYVVQGIDAADTAAIQDYAQQILDANAQPRIRVNQLVLPIRESDDLPMALLDLYDLVTVQNDRAGVDEAARLTTIQHEITATPSGFKWLVTVGFSAEGSVAPSTAVPAPPPGVGEVKDEIDGSLDQLNTDLDTLNTVTLPGVQADLADAQAQIATLDGLFPITSTSISDGAITTPKMIANSINGDRITANTLNASKIVALSITGDKIAANAISADKIVANTIGAGQLAANAVTAGKIAAGAIDGMTLTGVNIASGTVSATSGSFSSVFVNGSVTAVGSIGGASLSASGPLSAASADINGDAHANRLYADSFNGGGVTGASIGDSGQVIRTPSTRRVKKDIRPLPLERARKVLGVEAVTFRYRDRKNFGDAVIPGAISEQVAEDVDELWITTDAKGRPSGLRLAEMVPALIAVIRDQQARIEALEAR